MSTLKERMAMCRAMRPEVTQAQLAKACGVKAPSVNGWFSGETKSLKPRTALTAAQVYGCDPHWLADGIGAPNWLSAPPSVVIATSKPVRSLADGDPLGDGYVQIPEHTVTFSAGPGRVPIVEEIQDSTPATYRREWFQKQGIKPESARRFQVRGESMEPLLHSGDTVLVNLAEVTILDGKVYALRYGDELRIKRVYKRLDGGIILHSDNPAHRPQDEEIDPEVVQEHISIIGRVRDKSGSGGL